MTHTRSAGAYLHPTGLLVHSMRRAVAGFHVSTTPVFRLTLPASFAEIGDAVRKALDSYQQGTPDPPDLRPDMAAFLKATGFRSWKALEDMPARSCWIVEESGAIEFTPLKNGGSKGPKKGFHPCGHAPLTISGTFTHSELGEILLRALRACE